MLWESTYKKKDLHRFILKALNQRNNSRWRNTRSLGRRCHESQRSYFPRPSFRPPMRHLTCWRKRCFPSKPFVSLPFGRGSGFVADGFRPAAYSSHHQQPPFHRDPAIFFSSQADASHSLFSEENDLYFRVGCVYTGIHVLQRRNSGSASVLWQSRYVYEAV